MITDDELEIPLGAIFAIACGGFVLLVLAVWLIRYSMLVSGHIEEKGAKEDEEGTAATGTGGGFGTSCLQTCGCSAPSLRACLRRITPDKRLSCEACVTCSCIRGVGYGVNEGINWVCCDTKVPSAS